MDNEYYYNLIEAIQAGGEGERAALCKHFEKYINWLTKRTRIKGMERTDISQELYIRLLRAADKFNIELSRERGMPPDRYLRICLEKHCISLVKTAYMRKNEIAYNALSLDQYDAENEEYRIDIEDEGPDPREALESKLKQKPIIVRVHRYLSESDKEILNMRVEGYSYNEISDRIGKTHKHIDNKLQKMRKKIRKAKEKGEL